MREIAECRKNGDFPCGTLKLRIFKSPGEKWHVNMAQEDEPFDQHDAEQTTDAEISQRVMIAKIVKFLREHIPQCKNAELVESAAEIGIREGRRIVGEYIMCRKDIENSVIFEDAVCHCANSIDIHCKDHVDYFPVKDDAVYTIPYRALVVKDCDNVLAAGRCLSADRAALAAVRVMPPCFAMGEATGIAASVAVKKNVAVKNVPYAELREKLLLNGAYLGG